MNIAMRKTRLDEMGNLDAPPGSKEWALAVRRDIQVKLSDVEGDASHLRSMVELMREHKGYRNLTDHRGRRFATYQAFCESRPPFGLGYNPADIDAIIRERTARAAQERGLEFEGKTINANSGPLTDNEQSNCDIITVRSESGGGTSADYLAARITRDHPQIAERLRAGEFRSVRAAGREAGIVRPTAMIYTDTPEAAAKGILRHFRGERLESLIRALSERVKG